MAYTTLRITEDGVVLHDAHLARFSRVGAEAEKAFRTFVHEAGPGIWSVRWEDGNLTTTRREASSLRDGIPVRFAVSPFAARSGAHPKPASPNPYDEVRLRGVATLLTSTDGREILESCTAAVVGWDGEKPVLPPEDRPRVASTSESVVRQHVEVKSAPLMVDSTMPIALVNAVAGVVRIDLPDRAPFPDEAVALIRQAFAKETAR